MTQTVFVLMVAVCGITFAADESKVDYQKLADRTEFHWRAEESTILWSLSQMPHGYTFRMDYDPAAHGMSLSFLKDGDVVFIFRGHKHSVFKIHDDVLYYPIFHYSASGCQIAAYDLKQGNELWKTSVRGIGGVDHSAYRNVITLDVSDDVVSIHGHESFGDYIEFLDRASGQTVGHRTYNMKFDRHDGYRSDVPLAKVMTADETIKPGDSIQKVIDLFGQPRDRHKKEHLWSYFFAYGTPHADSTPMATVTVWRDGDVVRQVKVWFRPARDVVESAKERLKPGTTAEDVLKQLGRPQQRDGNQWRYSWEYSRNTEFFLDIVFANDQTVTGVDVRSAHVDYE